MADKNGKLTAWEIVNGNLLAMKMKDQVYIEVCDWELETIRTELEKYSKYKRAFDILKKMNGINRTLFISAICDVATDEEIELLEELMKDE